MLKCKCLMVNQEKVLSTMIRAISTKHNKIKKIIIIINIMKRFLVNVDSHDDRETTMFNTYYSTTHYRLFVESGGNNDHHLHACQQWVLTTAASTAKTESSRWDMPLAQIMATAGVGANETDKTQRSKREHVRRTTIIF